MEDGVWRTIGGRKIFIKNGEDLSTAMKNSGKFKNKHKEKKNSELSDEEREQQLNKLNEEINKTSLFNPKRQELRDKINMLEDRFDGSVEEYRAKKEQEKQERIKAHEERTKQEQEEKIRKEQEKKEQLEKDIKEAPKDKLDQYNIIQETNPMLDDYHVGIRSPRDIKTWEEVMKDSEESFSWGDFSKEDGEKALKEGQITIYSSYPIKNGVFVSTSKVQAENYAGGEGNKVYSKTISLSEVAWISGDEGQYAKVGRTKSSNQIYMKAYNEYKKEHPNSKITFTKFKENNYE